MTNNERNTIITTNLLKVIDVIVELSRHDMLVIEVRYDFISRPTITIEEHPYCKKIIEEGTASYYASGPDGQGYYQTGQFNVLNCRVIWKERITKRLH